jgi:hypothetical protein
VVVVMVMMMMTMPCADNHDVLSLFTYTDLGFHPEADDLIVTPKFGQLTTRTNKKR